MASPWSRAAAFLKRGEMGADPWSMDYFAPPAGAPVSPGTGKPYKRPVPQINSIFEIQKLLTQALQDFDHDDTEMARTQVEKSYKAVNKYLREYG